MKLGNAIVLPRWGVKVLLEHIPGAMRLAKIVLRLQREKDAFIQKLANLSGIGHPCLRQ